MSHKYQVGDMVVLTGLLSRPTATVIRQDHDNSYIVKRHDGGGWDGSEHGLAGWTSCWWVADYEIEPAHDWDIHPDPYCMD